MLLEKHQALTFDIENIKLTSTDSAKFRGLTIDNILIFNKYIQELHCVKRVQTRSFSWSVFSPNTEKYGLVKTPYLDNFHAVLKQLTLKYKVY